MCRIFFTWNAKHTKPKMLEFLKQTDHQRKFTPGLDNPLDPANCKDGFGFAWLGHDNLWKIYKQPRTYTKDPQIGAKIDHIPKRMVLGHLRKANYGGKTRENTQPFVYGPFVMIHNGVIHDFEKVKPVIENMIADEYKPHILGETDSEHLFFAFITAYHMNPRSRGHIETSVHSVFDVFAKHGIAFLANLVFGKPDEMYVGRHRSNYYFDQGLSLYIDKGEDSLVVSSEPVTENYVLIPENTGFLLH